MAINKRLLLINAEGVQSICLARSLRKQGHYVIGFCNHKCTSGYTTRWLSERYKSPDITHQRTEFKSFLFDYLRNNSIDAIIPLADDGAEFLSRHKSDIEKLGVKCAIPEFEVFNTANNKQFLMELCEKHKLSHPRTRAIHDNNFKEIVDYVGFPAMIKPNLSQGAKGIVRVDNTDELYKKYPEICKQFGKCTLQQFIEQPDYYYNVMLYRDGNGDNVGYTIIKIKRCFPLKGGSSCFCETIEHPSLLRECETVLDILGWVGFADFDVLEDQNTGELKIIEINPRVPSSLQAAFAAGVDFGEILMADLFEKPMPSYVYKTGKQVRWLGLDVMWFIFSPDRIKFKPSWFKFLGKNISYQDGAWNDPIPMLAGMFAGVLKYLNPEYRKSKLKT